MPFRFYWSRSVIRLWNDSIKSDNPIFRVVTVLMFLWPNVVMLVGLRTYSLPFLLLIFLLLFVLLAWKLLLPFLLWMFPSVFKSYADWQKNWSSLSENSVDIRSHDALNRRSLTYSHWFKEDLKPSIPSYFLMNNLSSEDVKRIDLASRLGSHFLEIEKGLHCLPRFPWKDRIYKPCASNKFDNALHLCKNVLISITKDGIPNLLTNINHVFSCLNSNLIADFNNPELCRFIANCISCND
jgi:hypothetical protein